MALVSLAPTSIPSAALGSDADSLEEAVVNFLCTTEIKEIRDQFRELAALNDTLAANPLALTSQRSLQLVVDAMFLLDAVPEVCTLLGKWGELTDLLHASTMRAKMQLFPKLPTLRARLAHVPGPEFAKASLSQIRVADRGRFIKFLGTVTRAGAVKVVQEWRDFRCEACGHQFRRRASPENGYEFDLPTQCQSGEKRNSWDAKAKRPKTMRCASKAFQQLPAAEDHMADFQELRVQDQMQALGVGVVPQSVAVTLFRDLVGCIQPGDVALVEGVVWHRWRAPWVGKRLELELFVEATHAERVASNSPVQQRAAGAELFADPSQFGDFWAEHREDEWKARTKIIEATAPWLSGLPVPKLALLLTMIGGSPANNGVDSVSGEAGESRWAKFKQREREQPTGVTPSQSEGLGGAEVGNKDAASGKQTEHIRTTPHLLLLGDPGTGKSQLLQAAQELCARSVRTSGLGCTNAGLTCAAVRDGPDFVLEAGALVLADGGVCCIDEFSTIRSNDRAAVHEAMEQQTVSVAKAGLVCRLRSQCSVVAAQNCKGAASRGRGNAYDRSESLLVNSGLPPPLLSRFDLVVVFASGGKGAATEQQKADFIIGTTQSEGQLAAPEAAITSSAFDAGHNKLREYIAWAKENKLPDTPAPSAEEVLEKYFAKLRSAAFHSGHSEGGITVRTFQALWRLAQAHARLMNHRCVQLEDAVAVVVLHRAALQEHVVGADSGDPEESFAASMPSLDGETAPCSIRPSSDGMELHHGTNIADLESYRFWEQCVLRYVTDHRPAPIMDSRPGPAAERMPSVPRSGEAEVRGGDASSPHSSQAGSQKTDSPAAESTSASQLAASSQRGRRLGWRMR